MIQRIRGFACMRYINPRLIDWLINDIYTTNDAICAGEQERQKVKKKKKGKKIDTGGDNFTYMGTRPR